MSAKSFKIFSITMILFFVFVVEFAIQKTYIEFLKYDGERKIEQCMEIQDPQTRADCLVRYIEARNAQSSLGVNGYLVIVVLLGVFSFGRFCFAKFEKSNQKKIEKCLNSTQQAE